MIKILFWLNQRNKYLFLKFDKSVMLTIQNYTKLFPSVMDPNYGVTQVTVEAQIRVAQTKVVIVAFVMAAHTKVALKSTTHSIRVKKTRKT
jgi:hypothetical protein